MKRQRKRAFLTTVRRQQCVVRDVAPSCRRARGARISLTDGRTYIEERDFVFSFLKVTHLCTLTCCAARPRPGSNRRDGHRAWRARAAEGRPLTR